ncbi:helix-turn-helix domain-containing protein [Bifidobacterium boum]|uniref:helix-turn-helix domain-containing protein n=1 Tax=Bifidobacterium boum TaxID=78343 RepID=UPI003F91DBAD
MDARYGTMVTVTPVEKDPSRGLNALVAATVRAERAARRITVSRPAEMSGMSKRTLVRLLNGERGFDVAQLDAVAVALGLTSVDIVTRAEARAADIDPSNYDLAANHDTDPLDYERRAAPDEPA